MNKTHSLRLISFPLVILACCLYLTGSTYQPDDQARAATLTLISSNNYQDCGTIPFFPGNDVLYEKIAPHIATCFTQAYQHCKLATMLFSVSGVDTITSHLFTIVKKQPHCIITDLVQHRVIPMPPKNIGNYTCSGLSLGKYALQILNCGTEGSVLIPLSRLIDGFMKARQ